MEYLIYPGIEIDEQTLRRIINWTRLVDWQSFYTKKNHAKSSTLNLSDVFICFLEPDEKHSNEWGCIQCVCVWCVFCVETLPLSPTLRSNRDQRAPREPSSSRKGGFTSASTTAGVSWTSLKWRCWSPWPRGREVAPPMARTGERRRRAFTSATEQYSVLRIHRCAETISRVLIFIEFSISLTRRRFFCWHRRVIERLFLESQHKCYLWKSYRLVWISFVYNSVWGMSGRKKWNIVELYRILPFASYSPTF